MFVSALAQQQAAPRAQSAAPQTPSGQTQPAQTPNMTGRGGFVDTGDVVVKRIRFEAGARTYWHTHSQDQIIVADEGVGSYQMKGEPVKTFKPGEAVFLKKNVPHWHGASPTAAVVQTTMYGGTIEWGKQVTDEEYAGKKK
jgi:quercetin dioxygenase-like cupin family protein